MKQAWKVFWPIFLTFIILMFLVNLVSCTVVDVTKASDGSLTIHYQRFLTDTKLGELLYERGIEDKDATFGLIDLDVQDRAASILEKAVDRIPVPLP